MVSMAPDKHLGLGSLVTSRGFKVGRLFHDG